jgi:hypothetical protein
MRQMEVVIGTVRMSGFDNLGTLRTLGGLVWLLNSIGRIFRAPFPAFRRCGGNNF